MSNKPSFNRSDFVRTSPSKKGKTSARKPGPTTSTRRSYRTESAFLPVEPRPRRVPQPADRSRAGRKTSHTQRFDKVASNRSYAFSLGGTAIRAPAISLPQFDFSNPRWISGIITIALAVVLLLMWNSASFTIMQAEVVGNQRIEASVIGAGMGIVGDPVFKAVPAQIEDNLRTAYTELSAVDVKVKLPNRVIVTVEERIPVLVWFEGDNFTWIDADGVRFTPRGDVAGLVQVFALDAPQEDLNNPDLPDYEQRFISPEMVTTIATLALLAPEGMPLIYDPVYGVGWQDNANNWTVYFGQNTQDVNMKIAIYQVLVDELIKQGIQPTLISVAYLDAPFYK